MPAKDALGRQFHTWDEVVGKHPEMGEHEDAVNWLAHAHEGDPEAEGSVGAHDLKYEHKNVPLRDIRNNTTGDGWRDPRVSEAHKGYSNRGAMTMNRMVQDHEVPPVLLVRRAGGYEVADGHHRSEAAKGMRSNRITHINAVVATSPHKTKLPVREY